MKKLKQKLYEKFGRFTKDFFGGLPVNPTLTKLTSIEPRNVSFSDNTKTINSNFFKEKKKKDRPELHKYLNRSVFINITKLK